MNDFIKGISNLKGGKFNKNIFNEIKDNILKKYDITNEIIYFISNQNDDDTYFMKIGSTDSIERRFNSYQTSFFNGIYCHGLVFKLKNNDTDIKKIERNIQKFFSYTKKIMYKRNKVKYSSTSLQIAPKQPFGEWFWLDIITFYESINLLKEELKNTVIILFLEKPIILTEEIVEFDWLNYIFKTKEFEQDDKNIKIIDLIEKK